MFPLHRSGTLACLLLFVTVGLATAQQKIVRMPPPVNHPAINASSPFISFDGKSLLYISDNTDGNVPAVFFTYSADEVNWKEPVMLPRTINNRLNYLRGFALSGDGMLLFISSTKGGGVGGYDLYSCERKGAFWSDPEQVGIPVNSIANEASPSLSADGTQMYFMRCEKMDASTASGCKLMMTTRRLVTSQWTEPVELPAHINTGNSQAPRIMSDGESLIFSSDKLAGKGGMDLYLTRRQEDSWSTPVPLDFVNTSGNNQFVSATSTGRYLLTETMGKMASELVQLLFPPEVKPKGVMKIEGKVTGLTPPTAGYVALIDKSTNVKINSARPDNNGSFVLYLKEGGRYTVSIDPEQDNFTFFMKDYDLMEGKVNTIDKLDATLKSVTTGDELTLSQVAFKPNTTELEESSKLQLDKLVRLMKGNTGVKFTVGVDLFGFESDSVASRPDLTETLTDSVRYTITTTTVDSTGVQVVNVRDSVAATTVYHNDRSVDQVLEIANYLVEEGVPAAGVYPSNRVFVAVPEERRIVVKVIAR